MKTRTLTMLCIATGVLLASAGWQGGCFPDPCPDLHIACPDLECPDGFKVGKDGCAMCECAGEEPEPIVCESDADCPEGQLCFFDFEALPGDVGCMGGAEEVGCLLPVEGECRPIEEPDRCEALDEWACIENPDCEPVYEELPCYVDCPQDDYDCFCAEIAFVGCREREPEQCRGAWIDENGLCRAPNDGVYPPECCGLRECWSDLDCFYGEHCQFPWDDVRPATDGAEDALVAEAGVCRPLEPECWSDADCPEGFYCDFSGFYGGERPADEDGGAAAPDVMWGGFCMPLATGCEGLDERSCLAADGCEPMYETICYPCDCADGTDCECYYEDMCEQWFVGCTELVAGECRTDADCPNGYCEQLDSCMGLDCPPPPPSQCVFPRCDDGTTPLCDMIPPICAAGETLAVRNNCYECVDARTCEQPLVCNSDADCPEGFYCESGGLTNEERVDCSDPAANCGIIAICLPLPDRCAALDEEACRAADGCEAIYEELPCLYYCEEGDPECMCGPVFAGCAEVATRSACADDADCAAGEACFDGLCVAAE